MNHRKFYIELGKLLYAIANADGTIQKKEISSLREVMKKEFVPIEEQTDEFGLNDAFYSEYEFEKLQEDFSDADSGFASFIQFMKENKVDVTEQLKESCIRTAENVASSFHNANQYEKYFLKKLKEEMKKI